MVTAPEVTYVVSRWGAPTQTFVRREADALARAGCDVRALSLRKPLAVSSTIEVAHLGAFGLLIGVARTACRRPLVVAGIVLKILRTSTPRNVPVQLLAALIGLAWAGQRVADGRHLHAHFGWVAATAAWSCGQINDTTHDVVLHAFEIHTTRFIDTFAGTPLRSARQVWCVVDGDRNVVARRWRVEARLLRMGVPEAWLGSSVIDDPWQLTSVGSLNEKKGHHILLEALALADARWHLDVIGEGPRGHELRQQAHRLGLQERVRFLGALPEMEVRQRLRCSWASPLACVEARNGDRDGVPVALMEAMAVGVPVVTTTVGGVPELVEGAGLLVEPGDATALAAALDRLRDPSLRRSVGEAGRQRVTDHWTIERSAGVLLGSLEHSAAPGPRLGCQPWLGSDR